MLIRIPSVLAADQIKLVHSLLGAAEFVDGKLSAGIAARRVKHNEELRAPARELEQLNEVVMGSLVRHPTYRSAALPMRVAAPYYARYTQGMSYGDHIDDPIMQAEAPYRSDISITVFLSEPAEYGGGELVVRTSFGDSAVKLPAGDAVLYPSSSLHHVNEVTHGQRLVAVTWLQSLVRDPARRELLYDLYQVRERMLRESPEAEDSKRVDKTYVNLVRMWGEV